MDRKYSFYNSSGEHLNIPGMELYNKSMYLLHPRDCSQDPFLVSVLISLAQVQEDCLKARSASRGDSSSLNIESVTYMVRTLTSCSNPWRLNRSSFSVANDCSRLSS